MRKAKLSVHISNVKAVITSFAVEIAATTKEVRLCLTFQDLREKEVTLLLKKAMGANYDRQTSQY